MIAPANSVLVEANAEAVDNDTCWTKIQIPCETSSTTRQAGLLKDLSSEKSIGLTVYKNHDVMDCYPWMFRNPRNGNCECSNIPQNSVLCNAEINYFSFVSQNWDMEGSIVQPSFYSPT